MRRQQKILAAALSVSLVSSARAVEGPSFTVTVQSTQNIFTATPATSGVPGFKPHINFPYMKNRADGTLEVTYSVGQTHGSGTFGMRAYSFNGGLTWTGHTTSVPSTPISQIIKPGPQVSYGVSWAFDNPAGQQSWGNGTYLSTNGGTYWTLQGNTFNSPGVTYINAYNGYGDMVQNGSTMFITGQAQRLGVSTFETVLFTSTNNGVTWNRRATIAAHDPSPLIAMGSEGPSESSIVQLNNGNMLSVFRTGQPFPDSNINATQPAIMWSMSSDQGYTWTPPKMLGVAGVFPLLRKLDDGSVALTYGRYGAKVMFADETGLRWTKPTVIWNGPSSGHTEMRKNNAGNYVFVYDQSSFYPPPWNGAVPPQYVYDNDQSANLKAGILNIQRQTVVDEFPWAVDYHGDVAPDALPVPWTRAQANGGETEYRWADLGQDYFRTNTQTAAGGTHLYFTAPSSKWSPMNFAEGVIIDVRSRAGSSTTQEGSADLVFGDGTSGYANLELTGDSVILEGLGGNGSQVSYTESSNPGFATEDWHDYRIIIAPDPGAGGAILAKVYLDGNYASPILTQSLSPAALDSMYFGDLTYANNGVLDIDYLRFQRYISQWKTDANGNWGVGANWALSMPSGVGATANFLSAISAARTVTLDSARTAGVVNFDSAHAYTLAGANALTLDANSGSAQVNVLQGSHVISAPVALADDVTINVAQSASTLTFSGNLTATGRTVTKTGAGTVELKNLRSAGLNVSTGTVRITPDSTANGTSKVASISLAGGAKLDLTNNKLVTTTSLSTITTLVTNGRNGGVWNGNGITTSMTDATNGGGYTSLGVALASEVRGIGAGQTDTWGGQIVTGSDTLVMYTYGGDANLSGNVDVDDYGQIDFNAGVGGILTGWFNGDFDYSGSVDVDDYGIIDFVIGIQGAPFSTGDDLALSISTVPEPQSVVVLLLATPILARRFRRR